MNIKQFSIVNALVFLALAISIPVPAIAADLSLATKPLFLTSVKPNVMVMLDNSGSMKSQMYTTAFNNATSYYGIFDATKKYEYDITIPVNAGAYSVAVDVNKKGAFVEANCVPPGGVVTCWSGNYLNWLTTKRIDSSRMVLVGGKLESNSGFDYDGDGDHDGDGSNGGSGASDLNYKIVVNNEPDDRNFSEADANSLSCSPIPNGVAALVTSPAIAGNVQAIYDPYAKIVSSATAGGQIYNLAGRVIGEFGRVTTDEHWETVNLLQSYANGLGEPPVVVAKPPTHKGGDPSVVRIRNVTDVSFELQIQEWDYRDGGHLDENIDYIVMEQGNHLLKDGVEVQAKTIASVTEEYVTRSCGAGASHTDSKSINFGKVFPATPVVIASVTTYVGAQAVNVRAWDIDASSMKLSLQEEENNDGVHAAEEVSYIAIEPAHFVDDVNGWSLKAAQENGFDESADTITFDATDPFNSAPFFLAGMQTINDAQPAVLRLNSISANDATIHVEEEQSCDADVSHSDETVGYIALEGEEPIEFNIALAVGAKPAGLLHDLEGQVGMGISFYRFNTADTTLYNQNQDGGTMKFKIPNNPFVDNPGGNGGFRDLEGYIGESLDDISDAIQNYPLVWGTTPLAENLWEVIQYFEQNTDNQGAPYYAPLNGVEAFELADINNPERDPYYSSDYGRKLECLKSSVIIFTDGDPYKDSTIPNTIVDYDDDANHTDEGDTNVALHGRDNLDDVAYWGYCDTTKASCFNGDTDADGDRQASAPNRDLRPDIENPGAGDGIPQYISVYTIGFGSGDIVKPILKDTANNAGGKSYAASDGNTLKNSLTEAFTAAIDESSASAVSVNTGSLTEDMVVFQAQFNSNDWTGVLQAYPICTVDKIAAQINGCDNRTIGALGNPMDASIITAHGDRRIATYNGTKGIAFQWPGDPANPTVNELTVAQQSDLADSELLLDYLRGDQSNEEGSGTGQFRSRASLLGDLINSSPAYVGDESLFVYNDLEADSHETFRSSVSGRVPMVYVGSNDGMLHAFNANSLDADDDGTVDDADFGKEVFAFVPNQVLSRLPALGNKDYVHQYTVDGSPTVGDAYFDPAGGNNKAWHTILVAGMNGGGQGIYALDITDPMADVSTEALAAEKVLWEFNDTDDDGNDGDGNEGESGDNDLGYTYSQPNIVRMDSGEWAAVFGNGYNSTDADASSSATGNAVLYIVSIETGELIRKIDTGVGLGYNDGTHNVPTTPNGLSTVAPVDFNGDNIVDFIYGGDLYGNLWRFNVTGNSNTWEVANNAPLFTASTPVESCDAFGICTTQKMRQPITTRPQAGFHPAKNGYMVYFGTGQYFESGDNSGVNQLTQTFYGIWDRDDYWVSFNNDHLLKQSILLEKCFNEVNGGLEATACTDANGDETARDFDLRISSDTSIAWHTENDEGNNDPLPVDGADAGDLVDTHLGWYMPLYNTDANDNPNGDNLGERQVSASVLRNGRIIFTTLIPSVDPCSGGGTGWLMELDAASGARLEYSPFDLNDDEAFNASDFVTVTIDGEKVRVPVSGKKSKEGIIASPAVVDDGKSEYKYNSGSKGGVEVTRENPGPQYIGRQSWKQLEF
ncbi:MAG: hypothetical protein KZQ64_12285 [gamma proteobacterium symbiont of Bathyaustriella thionipta]|nr:hypothetical protein [gamma proteobacterium symbiont of Bathyaustriella thionipta]MCU7949515.1 hypothetical protein [gamma proteobacterium symbiont of Bathyaustriella thionipta]MCU7954150.1 hypothetical protein [gamma proteobacterium symbiont of Bathyaustriella thionipta]MCU7956101.1 hypothetical protein [gamma proteobacterium symbiont of Bathyaustriella thionipta]MCU7967563.1 hypothetical protein [gamma proteobacterium symbiont of Bathyaustriella thionipta]